MTPQEFNALLDEYASARTDSKIYYFNGEDEEGNAASDTAQEIREQLVAEFTHLYEASPTTLITTISNGKYSQEKRKSTLEDSVGSKLDEYKGSKPKRISDGVIIVNNGKITITLERM